MGLVAYLDLSISKGSAVLKIMGLKYLSWYMYSNLMKRYWKNYDYFRTILTYKEWVGSKIKFAFSNIEFLKDWSNFLSKIV